MTTRKIIGVVGMPGSGKGILDDAARELGFSVIVMGDVIREETTSRGLEPTPKNIGKIMLKIREEEGPFVVAKKCIAKIAEAKASYVLIEGIRSFDELKEFRRNFPKFKLLAIYSAPETRFHRLFNRGRSDDSTNQRTFEERDERELQVGIGSAIAMADHIIVNEGDAEQFKTEVKSFLKKFIEE